MKTEQQHKIQDKLASGSTKRKKSKHKQEVTAAARIENERRVEQTKKQSRSRNYKKINPLHTNRFFLLG